MAISASLSPIDPQRFGYAQAMHLLNRAGFGGTPDEIATLQVMGLDQAVQSLLDWSGAPAAAPEAEAFDADIIKPLTDEEKATHAEALRRSDSAAIERAELTRQRRIAKDRFQMRDIEQWWLTRMIQTAYPLREKLTLLWHGHFASSYRVVQDSYLMYVQNQLFRRLAADNFATLLTQVIHDPATLLNLHSQTNDKAHPNEYLARVLLEQFALGPNSFTEKDVREAAKALTGYAVSDNDFDYQREMHDNGPKSVLRQRGNLDGDKLVGIVLQQKSCKTWVGQTIYNYFVGHTQGTPSPEAQSVIQGLASRLGDNQYDLADTLRVLFKSEHFYDPTVMGRMVKSPAHVLVGTARLLNTPQRDLSRITAMMDQMGQRLFAPASPQGWPNGRDWLNAATLCVRQNLCVYLLTGKLPSNQQWSGFDINYDPIFLLNDLPNRQPEAVVDYLSGMLLGHRPMPQRRRLLIKYLEERDANEPQVVLALLLLITAMPEYQLC